MLRDAILPDRLTTNEVLLNNPLQHRRVAVSVPGSFGVDHCNRTAEADTKAIGLGTEYSAPPGELQFFQSLFEKVPGDERSFPVAAFRLALVATQEDVASDFGYM